MSKTSNCPLQWSEKHESMFPTFCLCVREILGIVGSQIETKRIFSLVGILINLRRCHYNQMFLDKLIFINKKSPDDLRIGCKSPSSLVEFIETNVYLKELEELEKTLEEMKLWNFKFWIKKFLTIYKFSLQYITLYIYLINFNN
jgi:hypothetical protein